MVSRINIAFSLVCAAFLAGCEDEPAPAETATTEINSAAPVFSNDSLARLTGDVSFPALMAAWKDRTQGDIAFYNAAHRYYNCYGYAAGSTGSPYAPNGYGDEVIVMAVPGARAEQPMKIFTVQELHAAVIADGFIPVEGNNFTADSSIEMLAKEGHKLVAAFIDSRIDDGNGLSFHFAVRDDNGEWSHKNGSSPVMTTTLDGRPLEAPHQKAADYLGPRYEFAGYYWRPDDGLNVIAGAPPVGGLYQDGAAVQDGLYNPSVMHRDIWIGTRSDYLGTSMVIEDIAVSGSQGHYSVLINNNLELAIPDDLVFPHYNADYSAKTGNDKFEIMDAAGVIREIVIQPDGEVLQNVMPPSRPFTAPEQRF